MTINKIVEWALSRIDKTKLGVEMGKSIGEIQQEAKLPEPEKVEAPPTPTPQEIKTEPIPIPTSQQQKQMPSYSPQSQTNYEPAPTPEPKKETTEYYDLYYSNGVISQASTLEEAKARCQAPNCKIKHTVMEKEDSLYRTVKEEWV